MALGVFSFTSEGRHRLAGVLRALLIAQLVVSLCMVIFCYNTSMKVLLLLKHIHKTTVFFLYGLLLLQAYCMKLHYTSGLRLMSWFLRGPYWTRVTAVSSAWMISGSLVAVNGLLVYAGCRGTLGALLKELSSSLRVGISQYLVEPTWKKLLDTMQVELSCCGAENPNDWHEIAWLNIDFLNEESDLVMKLAGTDGRVISPVTPYSCCTPWVLAPCYHDPLQQAEWRSVWFHKSPLVSASLHTRGCVEAVRAPLIKALLALKLLNILVMLFQLLNYVNSRFVSAGACSGARRADAARVCAALEAARAPADRTLRLQPFTPAESLIVILTQLLRTSARDAILRGDCHGPGTGCLFGTITLQKEDIIQENARNPRQSTSETCTLTMPWPYRRRRRRAAAVKERNSYPYLS